jgi:hypothetical protein
MIIVKQEQMQGHDISLIQNIAEMSLISEIIFQQRIFVQKSTFPSRFKEKLIDFVQDREENQEEFLIIDCGTYLTLWVEKIVENAINSNKLTANVNSLISTTNIENNSSEEAESDKQYVEKLYRGVIYREKLEAPSENSQQTDDSIEKRKYRGSYY